MCEVLPTIDEMSPSPDVGEGDGSKLEQLMMSMLEERDKLVERLREAQEEGREAGRKLAEVEGENTVLMRQLEGLMPEGEEALHRSLEALRQSGGVSNGHTDDMKRWPVAKKYAALARELAVMRGRVEEKEEEVRELKSERNNTRLLLEHLECLVARHEKSLRMTVIKKQTAHQAGMSSEVEVLKALKSLFDHHKALDEKVRERLRTAQERNAFLEDELMLANQEIRALQDDNKRLKRAQNRNSVLFSRSYDQGAFSREQLALLEDRDQTISDLQFNLDERNAELEEAVHYQEQLGGRVQELEEEVAMAMKELQREQAASKVTSIQNNELVAARAMLESRVTDIQSELLSSQQEGRRLRETEESVQGEMRALRSRVTSLEEEVRQSAVSTHSLQRREKENEVHLESQLKASKEEVVIAKEQVSRLQVAMERMRKEGEGETKTHLEEKRELVEERTHYRELSDRRQREAAAAQKEIEQLNEELQQLKSHLRMVESITRSPSISRSSKLRPYSWQLSDPSSPPHPSSPPPSSAAPSYPPSLSSHSLSLAAKKDKLQKVEEEEEGSGGGAGAGEGVVSGEGVGGEGGDVDVSQWELGDLADQDYVSKLMLMLEGQVSQIDNKLKTMGDHEGLAEASQFDQLMQSVVEGTYTGSSLEPLPRSSPPGSRISRKYKPEVLPSAIYRVTPPTSTPPSSPPPSLTPPTPHSMNSPTASNSSSNDSVNSGSSKYKWASRRSSLGKLFRRKDRRSRSKKNAATKRYSEPVRRAVRQSADQPLRESVDFGELLETSMDRDEDRRRKSELLTQVLQRGLHFSHWDTSVLVAWLEVWVGVPYWYIAAIRNCIRNGATLASLTGAELEQEFGITNTLHRLKLRLAVQEMVSLTSSPNPHLARTTSLYGEMGHEWISDYWLPSLGLPQYKEVFRVCLVDARMLEYLTKKDLRTALKMVDASHRNSLQYGISVLKKLDYNREELERRRSEVDVRSRKDVLMWTNSHVQAWVGGMGLSEHATCLTEAGMHGGVIAFDNDLDHEKVALALRIPLSSFEVRKQLKTEFEKLLLEGTSRVSSEPQSHGKIVRKLSRRLKVGTRKLTPPTSEFIPVRSSSPVLFPSCVLPPHFSPLLEEGSEIQNNSKEQTV